MRTGFYKPLPQGNPTIKDVDNACLAGYPLVLVTTTLDPSTDVVAQAKLDALGATLRRCEQLGLGAIQRSAYSWSSTPSDPVDSVRIARHVNQVLGIVDSYADSVLTVQAGYFGSWGEWNNGPHASAGYAITSDANSLIATLLAAFRGLISVRCPHYRYNYLLNNPLEGNRIGIHNDSFASSNSNGGTYLGTPSVQYWKDNAKSASVLGGEVGATDPAKYAYWQGSAALAEVITMGVCYLNADYNRTALDDWKKTGHYDQIALALASNAPPDQRDRTILKYRTSLLSASTQANKLASDLAKEAI